MMKHFFDLRVWCLLFALWAHEASARFFPVNGGMVNQGAVVTTSGGTATAVATSNQVYVFEGASNHTFQLPDATKLPIDWWYNIVNNSTGSITVKDGSGSTIKTLLGGEPGHIQLTARANAAGTWKVWPTVAQSNLWFKPDYISSSSGVGSAGLPVKTNGSGLLDFTFFQNSLPLNTKGDILAYSTASNRFPVGTDGLVLTADSSQPFGLKWAAAGASNVTSISVASANGLAGTSSGGNTPTLTLSTTVNGLVKGNGTALSAAVANTDYLPATSGSAIQKANGAGGLTAASGGTDYEVPITFSTGLTRTVNTVTVNNSQNIATLSNLTTNGLLRAGGGVGTLSSAELSGDATTSGSNAVTVVNVNGVAYPASPSTNTIPVVTGSNTITYETAPVNAGGTGRTTLTNHGVLVGAGTSAVTQLSAAVAGSVLTGQGASADPSFSSTPTLGISGTTKGTLTLAGNTAGGVTVQPIAGGTSWTLTLPGVTGTNGQALVTDGTGIATWNTVAIAQTCELSYINGNGLGGSSSGETFVRNFTNQKTSTGSCMTYTARDTTHGDKITINTGGIYSMIYCDSRSAGAGVYGITLNDSQLSTGVYSQTYAQGRRVTFLGTGSENPQCATLTTRLAVNDVVRFMVNDTTSQSTAEYVMFDIILISL